MSSSHLFSQPGFYVIIVFLPIVMRINHSFYNIVIAVSFFFLFTRIIFCVPGPFSMPVPPQTLACVQGGKHYLSIFVGYCLPGTTCPILAVLQFQTGQGSLSRFES